MRTGNFYLFLLAALAAYGPLTRAEKPEQPLHENCRSIHELIRFEARDALSSGDGLMAGLAPQGYTPGSVIIGPAALHPPDDAELFHADNPGTGTYTSFSIERTSAPDAPVARFTAKGFLNIGSGEKIPEGACISGLAFQLSEIPDAPRMMQGQIRAYLNGTTEFVELRF